jgi:hypothetical protein
MTVMQFGKSLNTNDLFRTAYYQPKIVYWGFTRYREILTGVHETARYLLGFTRHREILTGVHEISREEFTRYHEILTGVHEISRDTFKLRNNTICELLG